MRFTYLVWYPHFVSPSLQDHPQLSQHIKKRDFELIPHRPTFTTHAARISLERVATLHPRGLPPAVPPHPAETPHVDGHPRARDFRNADGNPAHAVPMRGHALGKNALHGGPGLTPDFEDAALREGYQRREVLSVQDEAGGLPVVRGLGPDVVRILREGVASMLGDLGDDGRVWGVVSDGMVDGSRSLVYYGVWLGGDMGEEGEAVCHGRGARDARDPHFAVVAACVCGDCGACREKSEEHGGMAC